MSVPPEKSFYLLCSRSAGWCDVWRRQARLSGSPFFLHNSTAAAWPIKSRRLLNLISHQCSITVATDTHCSQSCSMMNERFAKKKLSASPRVTSFTRWPGLGLFSSVADFLSSSCQFCCRNVLRGRQWSLVKSYFHSSPTSSRDCKQHLLLLFSAYLTTFTVTSSAFFAAIVMGNVHTWCICWRVTFVKCKPDCQRKSDGNGQPALFNDSEQCSLNTHVLI